MAYDGVTVDADKRKGFATRTRTIAWWIITITTLVVVDDLTSGPVFWAISRWRGPTTAVLLAFALYTAIQIFVVYQGTSAEPHRIAAFFLDRLDLNRRSQEVARRERALHHRVVGGVAAVLMSIAIGGVIPPMLLWRQGQSLSYVRRLCIPCAVIYSVEFSLLHGWAPTLIG